MSNFKTKIIFFFIILFRVLFFAKVSLASECSNPKAGWVFYSCWDAGNLGDGGKWPSTDHCQGCSISTSPPVGGPEPGNAMKVVWPATYRDPNCSNGDDYRVEKTVTSPNPFYERFYFYSTNLRPAFGDYEGGSFCGGYKFGRYNGDVGAATGLYLESKDDNPNGPFYIEIKNHAPEADSDPNFHEYWYNYRSGEKLNGYGDWPGKQRNSEVTPNAWHSVELGVYRHDTNGWIKLWIDGQLAVNAFGAAFFSSTGYAVASGGSGNYNTQAQNRVEAFLQLPGFRNGGGNPAHTEYFDNVVISSSYIGPVSTGSSDTTPPAAPSGVTIT